MKPLSLGACTNTRAKTTRKKLTFAFVQREFASYLSKEKNFDASYIIFSRFV